MLKNYNEANDDTQHQDEKEIDKVKIGGKKVKIADYGDITQNLLEGVNLEKMEKKYEKGQKQKFSKKDIEQFMNENDDDAYRLLDDNDMGNIVLDDDTNRDNFNRQKEQLLEDQIEEAPKAMAGWGEWTGPGIVVKPPTAEELKTKADLKMRQIEAIRAKRKDKNKDNVILHQERNKSIKKYLVDDLPLNVKSVEQFDYLNSMPVGQEWNGIMHQER